MKKVLVYMASYNGSRFIREQIDSILHQKDVQVDLMIADDGSTDDTFEILTDYANKYANITVYRNEQNIGYKKNFMRLIRRKAVKTYDYYALSDQDDVWMPNKLFEAISYIERHEDRGDRPIAYSSNLTVVDEELHPVGLLNSPEEVRKFNHYNMLLENKCTGCTLVFNTQLREKINSYPIEKVVYPHDGLICRLAIVFGQFYFDERSFILYRQHGNNQIGANKGGKIKKYIRMLFHKNVPTHAQCYCDMLEVFSDIKDSAYFQYIYTIANYRKQFCCWCRMLFSWKFRKVKIGSTIVFKFAVFIRKY